MDDFSDRVRIKDVKTLSDAHFTLRETHFDYRRSDGKWQTLSRETFDRGSAAAVLPIDPTRNTVLLVRQFRLAAFETGHKAPLIEAIAGGLDGDDAETCARKEAREEAGVELETVTQVMQCFMSPGAMTEWMHLLVATYSASSRTSAGGGLAAEGEDIEVLELPFADALAMVARGEIVDAKTILLLQHAKLAGLAG